MDFQEYSEKARQFRVYQSNTDQHIEYCLLGLLGECGELANKYKKVLRGDFANRTTTDIYIKNMMLLELGDILWYLNELTEHFQSTLEVVAMENISKLEARHASNSIFGSGDDR